MIARYSTRVRLRQHLAIVRDERQRLYRPPPRPSWYWSLRARVNRWLRRLGRPAFAVLAVAVAVATWMAMWALMTYLDSTFYGVAR